MMVLHLWFYNTSQYGLFTKTQLLRFGKEFAELNKLTFRVEILIKIVYNVGTSRLRRICRFEFAQLDVFLYLFWKFNNPIPGYISVFISDRFLNLPVKFIIIFFKFSVNSTCYKVCKLYTNA